jgi:hypothetical protein
MGQHPSVPWNFHWDFYCKVRLAHERPVLWYPYLRIQRVWMSWVLGSMSLKLWCCCRPLKASNGTEESKSYASVDCLSYCHGGLFSYWIHVQFGCIAPKNGIVEYDRSNVWNHRIKQFPSHITGIQRLVRIQFVYFFERFQVPRKKVRLCFILIQKIGTNEMSHLPKIERRFNWLWYGRVSSHKQSLKCLRSWWIDTNLSFEKTSKEKSAKFLFEIDRRVFQVFVAMLL